GDDASEGMTAEGSAGEQGPPWDFGRAGPDGSGPDGAGSDGARSEPARLESPDFEEVGAWPVAALLEEMATGGAAPAGGSAAGAAGAVAEEIGDLAAELGRVGARLAAHGSPALHADAVGAGRLAEAARASAEAILASNTSGRGGRGQ